MKLFGIFTLLTLSLLSCKMGHDEPVRLAAMRAWINYQTNPISLEIRGEDFSMAGPYESAFDTARVYLSENSTSYPQLIATTTQTNLPLPIIQSGKTYYITVQGKAGAKTAYTPKPILTVADVIQPTSKLITVDNPSTQSYYPSPNGLPVIRTYRNAQTNKWVTQLIDASGAVTTLPAPTSDNGYSYFERWNQAGDEVIFRVSRSQRSAFVSYSLKTGQFTDLPMPASQDSWAPVLSPDARQLVYTYPTRRGLWYFDMLTKTEKQLDVQPETYTYQYVYIWTPDSQFIVYRKYAAFTVPLVVKYNTKTGQTSSTDLQEADMGSLSPNGDYVLLSNENSGVNSLWLKHLKTGTLRAIGTVGQYGWLNDGSFWVTYTPNSSYTNIVDRNTAVWRFTP